MSEPIKWRRFLPFGLILAALATAWALGLFKYLSWGELSSHHGELAALIAARPLLAFGIYFLIFLALTVLAVPGLSWLVMTAGFFLGVWPAAVATTTAGSIGGVALFLAARGALREPLARRAGPFMARIEAAFHEDEVLYLMAIRLSVVIPYCVANIAPALLGTQLKTFTWTLVVSMIPTAIVYAWVGASLTGAFSGGPAPDFAALGVRAAMPLIVLSLLPLLFAGVRHVRRRRARAAPPLAPNPPLG